MKNDIKEILFSTEELEGFCKRLGTEISKDYYGKDLLVIGVLKGCNPFMADLLKYITIPCQIDYMICSSYSGTKSTGFVQIVKDVNVSVENKHVIIVEDIVDTGRTLNMVCDLFKERKCASVEVCTLLDKKEGRVLEFTPKYIGTDVQNLFVVGYGLDYNEYYRNLPYIGVLKEEVYKK